MRNKSHSTMTWRRNRSLAPPSLVRLPALSPGRYLQFPSYISTFAQPTFETPNSRTNLAAVSCCPRSWFPDRPDSDPRTPGSSYPSRKSKHISIGRYSYVALKESNKSHSCLQLFDRALLVLDRKQYHSQNICWDSMRV